MTSVDLHGVLRLVYSSIKRIYSTDGWWPEVGDIGMDKMGEGVKRYKLKVII